MIDPFGDVSLPRAYCCSPWVDELSRHLDLTVAIGEWEANERVRRPHDADTRSPGPSRRSQRWHSCPEVLIIGVLEADGSVNLMRVRIDFNYPGRRASVQAAAETWRRLAEGNVAWVDRS